MKIISFSHSFSSPVSTQYYVLISLMYSTSRFAIASFFHMIWNVKWFQFSYIFPSWTDLRLLDFPVIFSKFSNYSHLRQMINMIETCKIPPFYFLVDICYSSADFSNLNVWREELKNEFLFKYTPIFNSIHK